jgi:hypothetical protein
MVGLKGFFVAGMWAVFGLAACEVAPLPGDTTTRDTRDTADAGDDIGAETDTSALCDPGAEVTGCPTGQFCETTARLCVECVGYAQRCVGEADRARRETCEPPRAAGIGLLTSGGFFESDPCGVGEVCESTGVVSAECRPKVCEAGFSTCVSGGRVSTCNASGTALLEQTCQAGRACYAGACEPVRHNVMLIFDTSGSMWFYLDRTHTGTPFTCLAAGTPCMDDFPLCDDPADPLTLLTLSKTIFAEVVDEAIGGFAQYALSRFPQFESPANAAGCMVGWYGMSERMTGDDDSVDTTTSSWFADNLGEVVAVPFPVRVTLDNSRELTKWLDNAELLGATEKTCSQNSDCGARGRCGDFNGDKRCFEHENPELRASGQTPLGKSLFYAAEYLRRFVRVDGKACTTDASCGSAGYMCLDNQCVDPYRKCKDDYIILFTDGDESQHQSETEFFNPVVQAKRLAYGLDCTSDVDCRGGAACTAGKCLGPGQSYASLPEITAGAGVTSLSSPDGQPISIKTTTITLDGLARLNNRIAYAGGGVNVDVSSGDPASFRDLLYEAMTPNFKCQPEEIEDLLQRRSNP